jgi:hypothetical protein
MRSLNVEIVAQNWIELLDYQWGMTSNLSMDQQN